MTIRDKISRICAPLVFGMAITGCTTSMNFVDYQEQGLYSSSDSVGGMDYVEIGPVTAGSSGFIWQSCDELQQEALEKLQKEVGEHSANRVFDVRWVNHSRGTLDETPVCTTRWGWFAGAGLAGLGPWMKATEVRGKLAFADSARAEELQKSAQAHAAQTDKAQGRDGGSEAEATDGTDQADKTAPATADGAASAQAETDGGGGNTESVTNEGAPMTEARASDQDSASPAGESDPGTSADAESADEPEAPEESSDAATES